jgi:nitrite reductase (NO-forming)
MQVKIPASYFLILVLVVVVIGGYFLLKGGSQVLAPAPTPTITEVTTSEVKEITVSGTEFAFSPSTIIVKAGEQVKINFKNEGGASHNLIIEGLEAKTGTIGSGQTDTIEFTAPVSGTYTFFCSVPGHRAAGMEGSLKVE